tara:strand:+ start:477 stop:965 length:489 start_codon:yes stop_codon:yes gene_type:complete
MEWNNNSIKEITEKINEVDITELKYKPLNKEIVLNLNYGQIYILKEEQNLEYATSEFYTFNSKLVYFFILIKTPNYFINPNHNYYNENGYTLMRILLRKDKNRLQGGRTVWSQTEVENMENVGAFFYKYGVEGREVDVKIAELPSSRRFLNWNQDNPLEVKE